MFSGVKLSIRLFVLLVAGARPIFNQVLQKIDVT